MFFSYINEIYLVADFWWNVSLDESGVAEFPQLLFGKLIIVAEFPRAAEISENLRYSISEMVALTVLYCIITL